MLFLMEMVTKMKSLKDSPWNEDCQRSQWIKSVHGKCGWWRVISDVTCLKEMVEAIVQLPENLFYNTGITTYIWLLTNKNGRELKAKLR